MIHKMNPSKNNLSNNTPFFPLSLKEFNAELKECKSPDDVKGRFKFISSQMRPKDKLTSKIFFCATEDLVKSYTDFNKKNLNELNENILNIYPDLKKAKINPLKIYLAASRMPQTTQQTQATNSLIDEIKANLAIAVQNSHQNKLAILETIPSDFSPVIKEYGNAKAGILHIALNFLALEKSIMQHLQFCADYEHRTEKNFTGPGSAYLFSLKNIKTNDSFKIFLFEISEENKKDLNSSLFAFYKIGDKTFVSINPSNVINKKLDELHTFSNSIINNINNEQLKVFISYVLDNAYSNKYYSQYKENTDSILKSLNLARKSNLLDLFDHNFANVAPFLCEIDKTLKMRAAKDCMRSGAEQCIAESWKTHVIQQTELFNLLLQELKQTIKREGLDPVKFSHGIVSMQCGKKSLLQVLQEDITDEIVKNEPAPVVVPEAKINGKIKKDKGKKPKKDKGNFFQNTVAPAIATIKAVKKAKPLSNAEFAHLHQLNPAIFNPFYSKAISEYPMEWPGKQRKFQWHPRVQDWNKLGLDTPLNENTLPNNRASKYINLSSSLQALEILCHAPSKALNDLYGMGIERECPFDPTILKNTMLVELIFKKTIRVGVLNYSLSIRNGLWYHRHITENLQNLTSLEKLLDKKSHAEHVFGEPKEIPKYQMTFALDASGNIKINDKTRGSTITVYHMTEEEKKEVIFEERELAKASRR